MPSESPPRLLWVLEQATRFLAEHGSPTPRLDAQILLAHVLDCDRIRLYLEHERPLTTAERDAYRTLIRRRAQHEPVAYLIQEREFYALGLRVDNRVLIPRPDTETLIEEIEVLFAGRPVERFIDVGTGSGCLACALATRFPESSGVASDLSPDALQVAALNLARHGLAQRVRLVHGHLLQPVAGERFDLIVSNPPYIPTGQLQGLPMDVRLFEPRAALDGGVDGLSLISELVAGAVEHLTESGWLVLEVGDGQAGACVARMARAGLDRIHTRADLAGIQRAVAGCRPAGK